MTQIKPTTVPFTLLLLFAAGCGSGHPELGRVTGTVNYLGKPLPQGTIILEPVGGRPATGRILDGEIIEVTTYRPGDGATLGKHQVAIQSVQKPMATHTPANPVDADAQAALRSMETESLLPPKFGDPARSGLSAEIESGDNQLTFDLGD
ncbi:hypothetical protein Pan216_11960 [Planctomycetes bacterium Pan216]|uniref:Uncharacterized protein n=1 Tax=Kolteria novifilia TaxID=2527975 RepID=A0A518B048_9BACT|nr:hypothetical protein Pan216_11960 [Planctomycetes bacterium Pan216]